MSTPSERVRELARLLEEDAARNGYSVVQRDELREASALLRELADIKAQVSMSDVSADLIAEARDYANRLQELRERFAKNGWYSLTSESSVQTENVLRGLADECERLRQEVPQRGHNESRPGSDS